MALWQFGHYLAPPAPLWWISKAYVDGIAGTVTEVEYEVIVRSAATTEAVGFAYQVAVDGTGVEFDPVATVAETEAIAEANPGHTPRYLLYEDSDDLQAALFPSYLEVSDFAKDDVHDPNGASRIQSRALTQDQD